MFVDSAYDNFCLNEVCDMWYGGSTYVSFQSLIKYSYLKHNAKLLFQQNRNKASTQRQHAECNEENSDAKV